MRQGIKRGIGCAQQIRFLWPNRHSEGTAMKSSLKKYFVLPFAVILGLLFFFASGSSGGPQAQGKGYTTATFFVA
jgi:hypothetical protein